MGRQISKYELCDSCRKLHTVASSGNYGPTIEEILDGPMNTGSPFGHIMVNQMALVHLTAYGGCPKCIALFEYVVGPELASKAKETSDQYISDKAAKEKAEKEKEKAEIEEIKQRYEQEIRLNPNDAEVYIRRGYDFSGRGLANGINKVFIDCAIADFTEAIKLDPKAIDAYFGRAGLYTQIDDYAHAIDDYNQAIQIDPQNAESYAFRGALYNQERMYNYDQALADFNEAIRLNPQCTRAYSFRGGLYFGSTVRYKEKADYDNAVEYIDKAIADIEKALMLDPEDGVANFIVEKVRNEKQVVYRKHLEQQEKYNKLVQEMNNASTEGKFQDLCQQLRTMGGYKNTTELAKECDNKFQDLKKDREFREREQQYNRLVQEMNKASTEKEYKDLCHQLRTMASFKNTIELANECDSRYQELKKERELREAEEAAKREAKKKKLLLIGLLAAVVAVAVLILFIYYRQTGSFFKSIQNNQGTVTITGYSGKKQVMIPTVIKGKNVTEIGFNAFSGKKLNSITIPDGITHIGKGAFQGNLLTSIIIPDSVTIIGDYAFFENKLTSVTIGNSVISIGGFAFSGNQDSDGDPTNDGNQLTNIIIPDSVTTIGERAFRYNQLTSVTIGNNVRTIENRAFSTNKLTSITLPDSVATIGEAAFINNQLTSIVIPNGVNIIVKSAFYNNKLTSVTIGNNVSLIGDTVFRYNSLSSITIPNNVTTLGVSVFADNPVTSIRLGANVKLGDEGDYGILGKSTGFNTAYANQNNRAGTYTRPNTNSTTWTRR